MVVNRYFKNLSLLLAIKRSRGVWMMGCCITLNLVDSDERGFIAAFRHRISDNETDVADVRVPRARRIIVAICL